MAQARKAATAARKQAVKALRPPSELMAKKAAAALHRASQGATRQQGSSDAGPSKQAVAAGRERGEVAAKLLELRGGSNAYATGLGTRIGVLYGGDGFGAASMLDGHGQR